MENYLEIIGEWINPDISLSNIDDPFVFWKPDIESADNLRIDGQGMAVLDNAKTN